MGFSTKQKSLILLEKSFILDKDYKQLLNRQVKQTIFGLGGRGGHNKETFMLTVKTFKLFCIKADTKRAKDIHEYFIKLEEIMHQIIQEESNELRLQLEQAKNETKTIENINKKEYEIKLGEQKMIEREKILLKEYGTIGSIVYFVKVKTFENGTYIIKIGESRKGITGRYNEHKSKYEECLLLDCFAVNNSKGFETFLHEHDNIRLNKVTDLPNHETELELFLIGKKLSYQTLLQIANHNHKYFNDNDNYKLELENDKLKMMLELKQNDNGNVLINELIQQVKHLSNKMDNLEKSNKEILEKFNSAKKKTTNKFKQK